MKSLLLTVQAVLALLPALRAQEAAPTPAPPVSAPQSGMAWEIEIRPAPSPRATPEKPEAAAGAQLEADPVPAATPTRITGRCGPSSHAWTVELPGGNRRDFLLAGQRLFAWNEKAGKLSMPDLRDGEHDEALDFAVSGFPGIGWVKKSAKAKITLDPRSRTRQATYLQEASPPEIINEGTEEEYARPTGPTVRVVARFDAATGYPVSATVGNLLYTYRIDPKGGGEPQLPDAFRQAVEARLKREAALQTVIEREKKSKR